MPLTAPRGSPSPTVSRFTNSTPPRSAEGGSYLDTLDAASKSRDDSVPAQALPAPLLISLCITLCLHRRIFA